MAVIKQLHNWSLQLCFETKKQKTAKALEQLYCAYISFLFKFGSSRLSKKVPARMQHSEAQSVYFLNQTVALTELSDNFRQFQMLVTACWSNLCKLTLNTDY
jgi:hypothetical protein